jgi:hypothetical protein
MPSDIKALCSSCIYSFRDIRRFMGQPPDLPGESKKSPDNGDKQLISRLYEAIRSYNYSGRKK